jgi:hypothetical protein
MQWAKLLGYRKCPKTPTLMFGGKRRECLAVGVVVKFAYHTSDVKIQCGRSLVAVYMRLP